MVCVDETKCHSRSLSPSLSSCCPRHSSLSVELRGDGDSTIDSVCGDLASCSGRVVQMDSMQVNPSDDVNVRESLDSSVAPAQRKKNSQRGPNALVVDKMALACDSRVARTRDGCAGRSSCPACWLWPASTRSTHRGRRAILIVRGTTSKQVHQTSRLPQLL